jgi:hypothetical protein
MSNNFGRTYTNFGGLSDPNHWTPQAVAARAAQANAQPTFGRAFTEGYKTAGYRVDNTLKPVAKWCPLHVGPGGGIAYTGNGSTGPKDCFGNPLYCAGLAHCPR